MNRLIQTAAATALCLWTGIALAQTPANMTIVSGNGQLICQQCTQNPTLYFQPLTVQVTDANGNPISGATVNWAVTSFSNGGTLSQTTTATDTNGLTTTSFSPAFLTNGSAAFAYSQSTIQATSGSTAATFYLTQGLVDTAIQPITSAPPPISLAQPGTSPGGATALYLGYGALLSGQVGSTSANPIVLRATTAETGQPVPNIAVNIFNLQNAANGPTAQCASGSGAGTNTVLTDANGTAVCNVVFGGLPNVTGNINVNVGSALPNNPYDTTSPPPFYFQFGGNNSLLLAVSPATPGMLTYISGSGQTAQAGQALAASLVVAVYGSAGTSAPISGQAVNWAVSPAGAATLGSASTTTGGDGTTSNTVTLSSTASGTVQVTASVPGTSLTPLAFNITAIPTITATGLTAVSGDKQTAVESKQFSAPLVVQLSGKNSSGQAVGIAGAAVQFSISGPGTLSSTSGTTDSNGQASVNVTAGSTAGAVTVTAKANGFSTSFSLTVVPPGPQLTASSFLNGADFQVGSISPCSIATIEAAGLAPGLQTVVSAQNFVGPLPFTLGGDSLTVNGGQAPIFNVGSNQSGSQQLTFQVPCDATPGSSVPVALTIGSGSPVTVNVALNAASPGIFETVMTDNVSRAVIVRPDGSFVSLTNPARKGETLTAFATGFGPSTPSVGTDALPTPGVTATPLYTVIVGMAAQGVPSGTIQLSPDLVGIWEVPFTIPSDIPSSNYPACGSGNCVTFSISVIPAGSSTPISSGTTTIPVQ